MNNWTPRIWRLLGPVSILGAAILFVPGHEQSAASEETEVKQPAPSNASSSLHLAYAGIAPRNVPREELQWARHILSQSPELAQLYYSRAGESARELGEYSIAAAALRESARLASASDPGSDQLGTCLPRLERALEYDRKARYDEGIFDDMVALGDLHRRVSNDRAGNLEAERWYRAALKQAYRIPDLDPKRWLGPATVLADLARETRGDSGEARDELEALLNHPAVARSHAWQGYIFHLLGRKYIDLEDWASAREAFENSEREWAAFESETSKDKWGSWPLSWLKARARLRFYETRVMAIEKMLDFQKPSEEDRKELIAELRRLRTGLSELPVGEKDGLRYLYNDAWHLDYTLALINRLCGENIEGTISRLQALSDPEEPDKELEFLASYQLAQVRANALVAGAAELGQFPIYGCSIPDLRNRYDYLVVHTKPSRPACE